MWEHPAVAANVATLRARGVTVLDPEAGALASGQSGAGRLPEPEVILEALERALTPARDLAGERVLVTAGPTREPVDPVRYISNRSSGKMGYAVAQAALRRGAEVVLVAGPTALRPPAGAQYVPVGTAEEMREAVLQHLPGATIVVKAAAVADYRAQAAAPAKLKSRKDEPLTLTLLPNPDILHEAAQDVARRRSRTFLVGFAAETHEVRSHAAAKLRGKGIDLMVANDVSRQGIGFEAEENQVTLLDRWGGVLELPRMSKLEVAHAILDRVLALRAGAPAPSARPSPR
jgi:phosphopantothenoylcysteine decarboxylase/phosphopantothenate--cysteine ligase